MPVAVLVAVPGLVLIRHAADAPVLRVPRTGAAGVDEGRAVLVDDVEGQLGVRAGGHLVGDVDDRRLDEISVADITTHAGVSYSTFFRHFSNKEELWAHLSKSLIEQINHRIAPLIAREDHWGMSREICEFVAENQTLYKVLLTSGAVDHTREAMLRNARRLASEQQAV